MMFYTMVAHQTSKEPHCDVHIAPGLFALWFRAPILHTCQKSNFMLFRSFFALSSVDCAGYMGHPGQRGKLQKLSKRPKNTLSMPQDV